MHPTTILILTFLSVSQNFVFSQTQPASPYWLSDGSSAIKIQNNSINSDPPIIQQGISYGAMWIDGDGLNSGEHLWTFIFRGENNGASVGLSNKEFFGRGDKCKGVFYNGNLSTCSGRTLVQNFGPGIHNDSTISLLISFTESEGRLKVYYTQDAVALGLTYDIPANAIPNLYPVVRFGGVGSGAIYQSGPIEYPVFMENYKKTYKWINGLWKFDSQNDDINGFLDKQPKFENASDILPQPILEIKSLHRPYIVFDYVDISLKVVDRLKFSARRAYNSWKRLDYRDDGLLSIEITNFGRAGFFEALLGYLISNPDTVSINSKGQLEMVKDGYKLIWDRDGPIPPAHFVGNPFEKT